MRQIQEPGGTREWLADCDCGWFSWHSLSIAAINAAAGHDLRCNREKVTS